MENLTKRQQIAMMMLQKHPYLIKDEQGDQCEMIINAFDFADYFIDLSEDDSLKDDINAK